MEKQDTTILNFATSNFFKCPPDMTVAQAHARFRDEARSMDVVMYFYIVDEADKLLGRHRHQGRVRGSGPRTAEGPHGRERHQPQRQTAP